MLKKLQRLPTDMALVSHSGVQFVDYGFRIEKEFSRRFLERLDERPGGPATWTLRRLVLDPDSGEFVDAESKRAPTALSVYGIQVKNALEAYNDMWLPAPFFKVKGVGAADGFEKGPSNWARIRVSALDAPDLDGYTHRLTIAFDTRTDDLRTGDAYTCPRPDDVRNETRFKLASDFAVNSWYLDERWVREWLVVTLDRATKAGRARKINREDQQPATCAHWAYYCVVLDALDACVNGATSNASLPTVRFLDTINSSGTYRAINVDLVLDIGNSRTCGVLIENDGEPGVDLAKSNRLELRDLARPQYAYREPFRSHVEFAQAELGPSFYSRLSGRAGAFSWPSLVRVGPEALRLNGASSGADGDTGLSGPKRYLWDGREHRQLWYFNMSEQWTLEPTPVFGEMLPLLTQDGKMLATAGAGAQAAYQPKFSKASLFCFMVIELLLQAISQINAPGQRAGTATPNVPRRLERVVLTIPTGTPLLERSRFQEQCDNAVRLLWSVLEWGPTGIADHPMPTIHIAYDEATCTQLVWLYTEIKEKFLSKPSEFLKIMGPPTDNRGRSTVRVASLDIGGGTTDLMITTYAVQSENDALQPTQNFREGFRRAGDDILEAVISVHVLSALSAALGAAGVTDPRQFITTFMADAGKSAVERHKRKLLVSRVLVPIALAMLSQYEANGLLGSPHTPMLFADIFPANEQSILSPIRYFEDAARDAGAKDFSIAGMAFELDFTALGKTVEGVIGPILAPLCEVIHQFQIDVLLVSGRPSRLPVIRDLLLRFMPTSPGRMVFMHEYEVGNWYPFSNGTGAIGDPKTTVVVGALLCTLASARRIPDFSLAATGLNVESTANYIGRLFRDGTIRNEDIVFSQKPNSKDIELESRPLVVNQPLSLGFRQLPLERWPGTPLFFLDISEATTQTRIDRTMPWTVRFSRQQVDATEKPVEAAIAVEKFKIATIRDRIGDEHGTNRLDLRLQTLRDGAGYWLDTGIVLPI